MLRADPPCWCAVLYRPVGVLWAVLFLLTGCAAPSGSDPAAKSWVWEPAYYAQAVAGHLQVLRAARPVGDWLADPATPQALRERLASAQAARAWASDTLGLPRNASYTRYAHLDRRAVVWNVVAAPALSLQLRQWCFPFAGCVGYRGYYAEADAQAFAQSLRQEAPTLDVAVYPVPAYSTLGWTQWLGGDPLLSTFLGYPQGEVARLLFHELAHQRVYTSGDTDFNESYATAVERLGGERWLTTQATAQQRTEYATFDQRRRQFRALALVTRARLQTLYSQSGVTDADKARGKQEALADFHRGYQALKAQWGGHSGYDAWVAQASNATFAVQGSYDRWVPAFEALFHREGGDFARFHAAVQALADLPLAQRHAQLLEIHPRP